MVQLLRPQGSIVSFSGADWIDLDYNFKRANTVAIHVIPEVKTDSIGSDHWTY